MASDRARPTIAWDESYPSFYVQDDDQNALKAKKHFSKPYIYYLGSDNGCGCGFPREYDQMIDDPREIQSKENNRQLLHKYLSECLTNEDSIELYSCWSGDEDCEQDFQRTILVDDILTNDFYFSEKQLTTITNTVEQGAAANP